MSVILVTLGILGIFVFLGILGIFEILESFVLLVGISLRDFPLGFPFSGFPWNLVSSFYLGIFLSDFPLGICP